MLAYGANDDPAETLRQVSLTNDPVGDYLKSIGKVMLLKPEQEVELSKKIEAGLFAGYLLAEKLVPEGVGEDELRQLELEGQEAKDLFVRANLRLVVSVARRYSNRGMPFLDLVQEGNVGLMHAVEKFDYTQGFKFSTYASWWIRQSILRAIADKSRAIRMPVHMHELINSVARAKKSFMSDFGRDPTSAELAAASGVPEAKLEELQSYTRLEPVSLNMVVGESGGRGQTDTELMDIIADKQSVSMDDRVELNELRREIGKVLDTLSARDEGVIRLRFGLDGGDPMTLDEIGKVYGLTRERIRQIVGSALLKLKDPKRNQSLRAFRDNS